MTRWSEFAACEPLFADRVQRVFEAHRHHTLATLRRDGSPRISGTEVQFADGDLWCSSMWQSRKALDLLRDPRFALHSHSDDPPAWSADARISGHAENIADLDQVRKINGMEETDPVEPSHLFRLDIAEVVLTGLGDPADHLLIEFWRPETGLQSVKRY